MKFDSKTEAALDYILIESKNLHFFAMQRYNILMKCNENLSFHNLLTNYF